MGDVADVVKRINYDMCMTLKVVGFDKDFIVSPDIVRGWMAPDAHFGDKHHNSFRDALRSLADPAATTAPWCSTADIFILRRTRSRR